MKHDHSISKMGRGRSWSTEELLHLAQAWLDATQDVGEREVKGTWQDSAQFWNKVITNFNSMCPVENPDGIYSDRAASAVRNQWKEKIARGCRSFNKALLLVLNSRPTGCNEQNKINIAVAIHLGKTSRLDYTFKDFQANDWPFYKCWQLLKGHRAFLPPSPPTAENMVNLEEEEEEEEEEEGDDDPSEITHGSGGNNHSPGSSNSGTFATPPARVTGKPKSAVTPKSCKSRGAGAGAKKTKSKFIEEDYKKKKAKVQEGLLEVQRKRQEDFAAYVNNQARATSFKMALSAYKAFIDHDPETADKYKEKMENIMMFQTNGDDESDDAVSVTDG